MNERVLKYLTFLVMYIYTLQVNALVPLESLELGDFSELYTQDSSDPLNYIFTNDKDRTKGDDKNKRRLAYFRGVYEEGENFKQYCQQSPKVQYATPWDRVQVKRAHLSTLQYLGLDITVRAIVEYARYFEFNESEFNNLTQGLIGNFCSTNISVISKSQLQKNFQVKFKVGGEISLPSIKDNQFFPKSLRNISTLDKAREREFLNTIELFKSFCSWGGEVDNLRLLTPLARSPLISSFVSRQMVGKRINWSPVDNNFFMAKANTVQVKCENLVCRRHLDKSKEYQIPKSVGHKNFYDDYKKIYCEDFLFTDYKVKDQVPKILKIIKQRTFDEDNFLISQFVSLLTGIPDFMARAKKYIEGKDFLRASMDKTWDQWAINQSKNFQKDLYYEEPLTIELVDNEMFYNTKEANLKVVFDVNLGEFDRANQIVGKLKTYFNIKISRSFLKWVGREWKEMDPRKKKYRQDVLVKFRAQISDQVREAVKKLPFAQFDGNFQSIIMRELLAQLVITDGSFYRNRSKGLITVPIEFNFAPFALRYLRFQYKIKKNAEDAKDMQLIFRRRELAKK